MCPEFLCKISIHVGTVTLYLFVGCEFLFASTDSNEHISRLEKRVFTFLAIPKNTIYLLLSWLDLTC